MIVHLYVRDQEAAVRSAVAAVGIGVYADAGQSPMDVVADDGAPNPIRLSARRARAMILEAADGQGLWGQRSTASSAWIPGCHHRRTSSPGGSPARPARRATYAHTLMGERAWTNAQAVVFPNLVLALYAADTAEFAQSLAGRRLRASADSVFVQSCRRRARRCRLVLEGAGVHQRHDQCAVRCDRAPRPTQAACPSSGVFGTFLAGVTAGYGLAVGAVTG